MDPATTTVHKAGVGLSLLAEDQFARVRSAIGDARVVLIGEETHGTQEFYALRAELTKALVEREGFSLVLCESDFPTFYELHRFVGCTHASHASSSSSSSAKSSPVRSPSASTPLLDADAKTTNPSYGTAHAEDLPTSSPPSRVTAEEVMEVLKERFPVWMWRNEVVRDFVEWLQHENLRRELAPSPDTTHGLPVALLGLDIYSMFTSTDQVIEYLDTVDPAMAERARRRYRVLQHFRPHEEDYCRAVLSGRVPPQHNSIRRMLHELHDKRNEFKNIFGDGDEFFNAYENARVVLAAEQYYRQSYLGRGTISWNTRDRAMAEMVVDALAFHDDKFRQLGRGNRKSRAVVWAHNSHIGDAAATELFANCGQVNVGHLVREVLGRDACFLIGLSTSTGTVRAARRWNGRDHVMELNLPLNESTGDVFHRVAGARQASGEEQDFGLLFRSNNPAKPLSFESAAARNVLAMPRLERFIGVQYLKERERLAHYSSCRLSQQFDMVLHVERTTALRPLPEFIGEPHEPTATTTTTTMAKSDHYHWDHVLGSEQEQEEDEEEEHEAMAVPP